MFKQQNVTQRVTWRIITVAHIFTIIITLGNLPSWGMIEEILFSDAAVNLVFWSMVALVMSLYFTSKDGKSCTK